MQLTTHSGGTLSRAAETEPKPGLRVVASAAPAPRADETALEDEVMTDRQTADLIRDLSVKYGLSSDRAGMLVDRFGLGRRGLAGAAYDLQEWRL